MRAAVRIGARDLIVDLSAPVSIARELDFGAQQPRHFGAPPASARPYCVPGFSGSVGSGASCNCNVISLIPHCNGTHTECAGHLTREPLDAYKVVPAGLTHALLLSVMPTPQGGDRVVTRDALEGAWVPYVSATPGALVIRTAYQPGTAAAPYLTAGAADLITQRQIEHLVVDLPSLDREHDEGRLTAHRIFFGLPAGSQELGQVTRPQATVTEFARVPNHLQDGLYLLELQVPAWCGDAVPSRPLLYPIVQST